MLGRRLKARNKMEINLSYLDEKIRSKIYLKPQGLVSYIEEYRKNNRTIVFGNGCFDLWHVGHTRYLYAAKSLGDILIIAVNTDDSMKRIKPDRKPIIPDYERFEIVAGIGAVDYVVPLEEDTPVSLIKLFKPNIHTKGTDYINRYIPEREFVENYGGKVMLVGDEKNHSTTQMLKDIRNKH